MNIRFPGMVMVLAVCSVAMACSSVPYEPVPSEPVAAVPVYDDGASERFYDDLAPYGKWVWIAGPGWVWHPYGVAGDWRPYQRGHWVFTDYGWTWASDEDWGWAVYHYGRWHRDVTYGWVWVPGLEWGPAWVAWHEGPGWIGWAPLPWQVRWQAGVGLDWGGVQVNVAIEPAWWCFVETRHLVEPALSRHIAPAARNIQLVQITNNVTHYTFIDNRVVNQSVTVERVGKAVGRPIPRHRVRQADVPESVRGGEMKGEEFVTYRPVEGRGRAPQRSAVPPSPAPPPAAKEPAARTAPARSTRTEGHRRATREAAKPVTPPPAAPGSAAASAPAAPTSARGGTPPPSKPAAVAKPPANPKSKRSKPAASKPEKPKPAEPATDETVPEEAKTKKAGSGKSKSGDSKEGDS